MVCRYLLMRCYYYVCRRLVRSRWCNSTSVQPPAWCVVAVGAFLSLCLCVFLSIYACIYMTSAADGPPASIPPPHPASVCSGPPQPRTAITYLRGSLVLCARPGAAGAGASPRQHASPAPRCSTAFHVLRFQLNKDTLELPLLALILLALVPELVSELSRATSSWLLTEEE